MKQGNGFRLACAGLVALALCSAVHAAETGQPDPVSSDWYGTVQEGIRKAEYNITRQDRCVIDGEPGGLHAANRANNLRAYFREDGVQIVERESSDPDWQVHYQFTAWGREHAMASVTSTKPVIGSESGIQNPKSKIQNAENRVEYYHRGIIEWYENTQAGLEHGFTIAQRPVGHGALILEGVWQGLWPQHAGNGIVLADADGGEVLRYAKLNVHDATGASVPANLSGLGGSARIVVNDNEAVYPLTVGSLYVPPPLSVSSSVLRLGATMESNQYQAHLGCCVSAAGDVNGDGYADVIVGAEDYDNGEEDEGAAFVFLGSASGLVGNAPGDAGVWMAEANQAGASLGSSVSGAGDVNGDGYADAIVGADYYSNGEYREGAAFVFLGSAAGLVGTEPTTAASMLESNQAHAWLGSSASGAGDVNGDGYGDVIVGAHSYSNGEEAEGAAFLFLGSASGLVGNAPGDAGVWMAEGNSAYASFGSSVSGAGDVNEDGYADVIVGASNYDNGEFKEGAAFVFLGSLSGPVGNAPGDTGVWMAEGNQTQARFGWSVSGAGDVNGDGYADVVVGSFSYSNGDSGEGAASMFLGSASGLIGHAPGDPGVWTAESNQADAHFGISVSGAGDVNGDGYADVIVGAWCYENGESCEGAAFVFLGSASGPQGQAPGDPGVWMAEPNQAGADFGYSVSGAGDVNGDGYADVVVGARKYNNGDSYEGAAFAFLGAASGLRGANPGDPGVWMAESNQADADFGYSVSGAGDVNGDGYADVIVGAPAYDHGESGEGASFVFLGSASGLVGSTPGDAGVWMAESNQSYAEFGISVSGAGDVNGDGYADVIVGAASPFGAFANGESEEGAAFVFLGSASGIQGNAPGDPGVWMAEGNQAQAFFGGSVSGAGDVNGDGYADVIVGADIYDHGESDEGAAFVFFGSASGLQGNAPGDMGVWMAEGNQEDASFGWSVSGAGDVNGDGYADVIIGAASPFGAYDHGEWDEGSAFVFLGCASGLVGNAPGDPGVWMAEGNQEDARFGLSVSGAGDINSDGYADVIVGARDYSNGEYYEGAAFVFNGSASGLQGNAPGDPGVWMAEGNQASMRFGGGVSGAGDVNGDGHGDVIIASFMFLGTSAGLSGNTPDGAAWSLPAFFSGSGAGDVNGDGYPDVIVGAPSYTNGEEGEGAAFVLQGGNAWGMAQDPAVLTRPDGSHVATPGLVWDTGQVRLTLPGGAETDGQAPDGPVAIRLAWEIKPWGAPLDGTGLQHSAEWYDPGTGSASYDELIALSDDVNGWHWRVRVLHLPLALFQTTGTPGPVMPRPGITLPPNPPGTRWHRPRWATIGPSDFRTNGYRRPTNVAGLAISPAVPTTQAALECAVGTPAVSPAVPVPNYIIHQFIWTSDTGHEVRHPEDVALPSPVPADGPTSDTLSGDETVKHETWACTVRAWDGVMFSHDPQSATVPEIQNTAPGAPTLSLPPLESTSQNLVCQISVVSDDPDTLEGVDLVQYDFDWYVKHDGEPGFTQFRDGALSPAISSQVNDTDTAPGDEWYCVVTPHDGEDAGTPATTGVCAIVLGGVEPSYISLAVSPPAVTLGQALTALGEVFPTPAGSGTVTFASTSPSGVVSDLFPEGTIFSGAEYSKTFVPTEASQGRPDWSLTTSWPGDDTYRAATSTPAAFAVLKAQPVLNLELNASSAPLDYDQLEATATMTAPIPSPLDSLLSGRTLKLWLKKPDASSAGPVLGTTDADGEVVFLPSDFVAAGIVFDEPGLWQFLVEFEGDDNFLSATSAGYDQPDSVRLTIKDRAGYAVIVLGKLDEDGEGHAEHAKTGDYVYRSMIERGLAEDDIYYLREGPEQPAPDIWVDDTLPTQAGVQYAIQSWAADKMNASPAPLYVVCLDHGSLDAFYMYAGSYDDTRIVTPIELDAYLDALESALSGPALGEWVVVMMGCCHAGSFIPLTSGVNRLVMASCASDEVSHRGPIDPVDGLRDGEAFVTELFRHAREGETLKASFEQASQLITEYTATQSNGGEADNLQHALLDDNGDGMGTVGDALSYVYGEDGAYAHEVVLGYGVNAGESVGWITATQTLTLDPTAPVGVLEAKVSDASAVGHDAWIEVKTPGYTGSTPIDPGNEDSQEAVELLSFAYDPAASDLDNGWFRWDTSLSPKYDGVFGAAGTYKVFYYVQDGDTDDVSAYLLTTIYRQEEGNQAPPPVDLIYPEDAAYTYSTSFFAWDEVADPEGGTVTYRLEIAEDDLFTTGLVVREGLLGTVTQVSGLADLHTYYWRVIPLDEYGAYPDVHEVRTFTVDNDNPTVPGALMGEVGDALTGLGVSDATVVLKKNGVAQATVFTDSQGDYFLGGVEGDVYSIEVSATGYVLQVRHGVSVPQGGCAEEDFVLAASGGTFRWGDLNADAKAATLDGSLILQWIVGIIDRFPIDESIVSPDYPPGGDVTGDGILGVMDVSSILQYRVGGIECFPADLDCDDFGPDAAKPATKTAQAADAKQARILSVPAVIAADPEDEIVVPVSIDDASGVFGFEFKFTYDDLVLEYVDFNKGTLTASWGFVLVGGGAGELTAAGASGSALSGSGTLVEFRFRVREMASGLTSPLAFDPDNTRLNDGAIDVEGEDGEVEVSGVPQGALTVTIEPEAVRLAGAEWRVDGGDWHDSGATVGGLSVEEHTVSFSDVTGWDSPGDDTITVVAATTVSTTGTYTPKTGAVSVTIEPEGARLAGAQWRVDGGPWHNSGDTQDGVPIGARTVSFKDVSGWTKPEDAGVTVNDGATTPLTRTYVCTVPEAPSNVAASDGAYTDEVRVTWDAAGGADVEYQVLRADTDDLGAATVLSGWIAARQYSDTTAAAPVVTPGDSGGCQGGGMIVTYQYHYYWVKARRTADCLGDTGASDRGHRGEAKSLTTYEKVLPARTSAEGVQLIEELSPVAVRLRSETDLDPATIWGVVTCAAFETDAVAWWPASGERLDDVWIVYEPTAPWQAGAAVMMTVGAATVSGDVVGPVTYRFEVADAGKALEDLLWQPSYADFDAGGLDLSEEGNGLVTVAEPPVGVPEVAGESIYRIGPDQIFPVPQRVWLPLPDGVDEATPQLYYYQQEDQRWYRGEDVDGWLVPDSYLVLKVDGVRYLGVVLRHGGLVRMTHSDMSPELAGFSEPRALGALLLFGVAASLFMALGQRPRHRSVSFRKGG